MTSKELKVAEVGVNLSFVIKSNLSFEKKKVFFYMQTPYTKTSFVLKRKHLVFWHFCWDLIVNNFKLKASGILCQHTV